MTVIEEDDQKQEPTIETLEQKLDELANAISELNTLHYIYKSRKKAIMKRIRKVRQLASDLNVDEIQLRKMISQSFTMAGVSESWLRKMLPDSLKFTKHTRKDYLERKQQRDQQPISRANLDKESEPFGKYTKAYNGGHFLIHGFITGISLMMKALKMMFFYLVSL
jgi:hypothetical protein